MELLPSAQVEEQSSGVVTLAMLRDFSRVAADPNLIHLDVEVARAMGLPNVIAHGMFVASLVTSRAEHWLDASTYSGKKRVRSMSTRFKAMTLLGDEIFTSGECHRVSPNTIRLDVKATNQRNEIVVESKLTIELSGARE